MLGILLAVGGIAYKKILDRSREFRAIANIRSIITAETAFHSSYGKFGTFSQLIDGMGILNSNFQRYVNGTGASEAISDGHYDYSIRFSYNSTGFTLDADPKPAYSSHYRRFRYRFRDVVKGQSGIILVSQPSVPPPTENNYVPLEN